MYNTVKRAIFMVALFFAAINMQAQDERTEIRTLFDNSGIRSNGGYGAVNVGYSRIADRDAILIGGQGAWLINHRFGIGLAGTGFITERSFDGQLNDRYLTTGGYGGLLFEFISMPQSPIHLSFPLVIGAGGVSYTRSRSDFEFFESEDSQAFFVVEPGVELELNVVKIMRMSFGVKYRYTSKIDLNYNGTQQRILSDDALNGLSASVSLKFGKF